MNGHGGNSGNRRSGGQQNPGGGQWIFELFASGTRKACLIVVRLMQGLTPKTGTKIVLYLGTEANPYQAALPSATAGKGLEITIDGQGFAREQVDLSAFPDYTHVVAVQPNGTNKMVAVPVEVTTPTATATKKTSTGQEIKVVNPPRDPDPTSGLFIVTVVTEEDGKPKSLPFVVTSSCALDIRQQTATGLVPTLSNFTPMAEGMYVLYIGFTPIQTQINFQLGNGKSAVATLRK